MNTPAANWASRLFVILQRIIPQHTLSRLMYALARRRWRPLKNALIRLLVHLYRIDLRDAAEPDLEAYPDLNTFFTRALRPGARPQDPDPKAILCPVDGTISQIGRIGAGRIIQAKGQTFSVTELLGDAPDVARDFADGLFATIYLAPGDYHRIHMPLRGELLWMRHLRGRLFSVNQRTASLVPGLFARNERVVCGFATDAGPMAMVLVGAIFVGGIETVWAGAVTPTRAASHPQRANPAPGSVRLDRGVEMGRFNLGSTVILLFPQGRAQWDERLKPGRSVRLGEKLGVSS